MTSLTSWRGTALLATLLLVAPSVSSPFVASAEDQEVVDFDADGLVDLAIGVPGENDGTGVVQVFYSHGAEGLAHLDLGALDESIRQDTRNAGGTSEEGDWFAAALATGDFDGDGRRDLAVGVPGENNRTGLVQVFYSVGAEGLVTAEEGVDDEMLVQGAQGIEGEAESSDRFGATLASGDFDGDGIDDLAVGLPGENDGTGAVHVFYSHGTEGFIHPVLLPRNDLLSQDVPGAGGEGEPGDRFGTALASGDFNNDGLTDLAVGVPGRAAGSGEVQIFYSQGIDGLVAAGGVDAEPLDQDQIEADDVAETGDLFGSTLAAGDFDGDGTQDLAVGAPGEDEWSGLVQVFYSSGPAGFVNAAGVVDDAISQDTPGVNGFAEAGDLFAAALASGDFDDDGRQDLAVGVPGENDGAGVVHVLYSAGPAGLVDESGSVGDESFTQDTKNADGSSGIGEFFGAALAAGDFDDDGRSDLAVGVPGEDRGAGLVQIFYSGGPSGLVTAEAGVNDESLTQATRNANGSPEPGDHFGAALPLSPCVMAACGGFPTAALPSCFGLDATVVGSAAADLLIGTSLDDVIVGLRGDDELEGMRGNDALCGGDGSDRLDGGRGDDVLIGGDGADVLSGRAGDDRLEGGPGPDEVIGGAGSDVMIGGGGGDWLSGGGHDDTMHGGDGNDRMLGHTGSDLLHGESGNDLLYGGSGDDLLLGGTGADRLKGGDGADALDGGPGNDKLFGGGGADTFRFTAGAGVDLVVDWERGIDLIDLSDHDRYEDFGDVSAAARQVGGRVVIGAAADADKIVLLRARLAELGESGFVF